MLKNSHLLHDELSRGHGRFLSYSVLGAGALSLCLIAGWWSLHGGAARAPEPAAGATSAANPARVDYPYGPMVVGLGPWARTAARAQQQTAVLEATVESAPTAATPPRTEAAAEAATDYPSANVPMPPRRPQELKNFVSRLPAPAPIRQAALPAQPMPAPAPADNRSFFEKMFGGAEQQPVAAPQAAPAGRNARRQRQAPAQASSQALAYAPAETGGGLFGGLTSPAAPAPAQTPVAATPVRAGGGTAVYDISAHMVYMPDGTRLEAHSGLGAHLDDPRFVHVRMQGPTPPSVYALSPREALFHGVEALRLTPLSGSVFGRAGLLAHTYMLGPNGASNGCVSFRDYNAFLQAYKRGEVRRLAVVARM
jgi:hypothetical protein